MHGLYHSAWAFVSLSLGCLMVFTTPHARAQSTESDRLRITIDGVEVFNQTINEQQLENSLAFPIAKAKVPPNAVSRDLVLNEPDGTASDVLSFILNATGDGEIMFTSDSDGLIIVPTGAVPIEEKSGEMNLSNDLFPNGAGTVQVFVTSDADVPEPAMAFLLGLAPLTRRRRH